MASSQHLDRRAFLGSGTAGALAILAGATPGVAAAAARPSDRTRAMALPSRPRRTDVEPWGRIESVTDGVWALVSTPLADHPDARRTLCNGGIIAGTQGVLVVEAFGSPEGAAWLSDEAYRRTGMRPTHVVLTHYHGDHVSGAAGYLLAGTQPALMATRTTRRLVAEQAAALPAERSEARLLLLPDVVLEDGESRTLDLGGRSVRLVPRRGHTASDLVVETDGAIFPGDLVWNGLFPNYMDAIPTELDASVRALRDQRAPVYGSGHGTLARAADLDRYIGLLEHVEEAARRALEEGTPLDEAAAAFEIPDALGDWSLFSPRYPEVAFRAWQREIAG